MAYTWNRFIRRIPVNASAKAIYDAWTTQQGLESWFLRLAQFTAADGSIRPRNNNIAAGDHYKWLWHGYDDVVVEERDVLLANGWDKLQFHFSGGCIVTVAVLQEQGAMICELTQEMPMKDIEEQQYFFIECGKGWDFYLTNLKSVLEGGADLRNKNASLKNLINA